MSEQQILDPAAASAQILATHLISREIGIDAGHRVMDHGAKCRNLHGHRYAIQAWCRGPLVSDGEETGMVLDFGFLKEEMMQEIDAHFDHAFIFSVRDELCREMFGVNSPGLSNAVAAAVESQNYYYGCGRDEVKICVLPCVPTAENLARFWFERLLKRVRERSGGLATLAAVKVWETPNCWACYGPETIG